MPRLLLCDDDIHILRAAEFKFLRAGYTVETAGDGLEAWEAIQRARPALVITDCQMPRLGGLGLVERIRENPATADIPVLMLTAKGFELPRDELAEKLNVLAVIPKPFSPRELLQRVNEILKPETVETLVLRS
jgi:two-component system, OmpR family, alkaline phosphatase synthesis response regulator PhoP